MNNRDTSITRKIKSVDAPSQEPVTKASQILYYTIENLPILFILFNLFQNFLTSNSKVPLE